MRRWAWAGVLALALAAASHAQLIQRPLPANGKLGELIGRQHPYPLLLINNTLMRLAPGGLIFDPENRTIVHGALPEHAHVLYLEDLNGDVARIYILRADERERLERAQRR
ncbi:MAG TPA: hypothetical protein VNK67_01735 [Burkholderiales bacterium]|nr:hypothetical protein [Burkholderiales bacterium]